MTGILCAVPMVAAGWGGRLHMDISRAAAKGVPEEMQGWPAYARLLAPHSIDPDLWKGSDLLENSRHFIDVETYAPLSVTHLPVDFAAARTLAGKKTSHLGQAPWVIMDLQRRITAAMAASNWLQVAQWAAAQAHYVGDLHQPLHTTVNYDGRDTGQDGVHLRWEVEMPGVYWRVGMMPEIHAEYLSNSWAALLGWIAQAHERIPEIYAAEDKAARLANFNVESRAYYFNFWQASSNVFIEQAHRAANNLASLWYTAWVDAGRPKIGPPPENLSEASIWTPVPVSGQHAAWPFLAFFGVLAALILALSLRPRRSMAKKPR